MTAYAEVHRREEPRRAGGNRNVSVAPAWTVSGSKHRAGGTAGARPQEPQRLHWEGCSASRTWSRVHLQNKYCILMHMYGIQKNGIDEPVCRVGIETQR